MHMQIMDVIEFSPNPIWLDKSSTQNSLSMKSLDSCAELGLIVFFLFVFVENTSKFKNIIQATFQIFELDSRIKDSIKICSSYPQRCITKQWTYWAKLCQTKLNLIEVELSLDFVWFEPTWTWFDKSLTGATVC